MNVLLKDNLQDSYWILQELSYRKVAPKILWDIRQDYLFLHDILYILQDSCRIFYAGFLYNFGHFHLR
jgi:hypothetical protein